MKLQAITMSDERRSSRRNDNGIFVAVAIEYTVFATAVDVFKRGNLARIKLWVSQ
jgi:hypothetical protein